MRWQQFFVAVVAIVCNVDFFASVLEYAIVVPFSAVAPTKGPAYLFQPVGALVPRELYKNFGIASQNLANTFSSTSSIFIDDGTSYDFADHELEFDLLWSAIGRACPRYVFTNNNSGNMALLENYVRTSGCLKTVFLSDFGAYSDTVAIKNKDGIVKVVFINEARRNLEFNDPSLDILYYVALGEFRLSSEGQRKLSADAQRWTIRENFFIDSKDQNGLKYMVFEDVLNLKRKLYFEYVEPISNAIQGTEVLVNHRSEDDYKMFLKTICAKTEGVDHCDEEMLLDFFKGDYNDANKLFLKTQYFRPAQLTKRQNCKRKYNCSSLPTLSSDGPNHSSPVDIFQEKYSNQIRNKRDIEEHLVTLRSLASGVDHVTEFGVRSGVSTFSWFVGGASTVVGYDLKIVSSLRSIQKLALECNRTLQLVEGDTATVEINETDILFIDSLHTGEHLRKELFRQHLRVRKYLVFHDTASCGEFIADNDVAWGDYCLGNVEVNHTEGLKPVIRDFLKKTKGDWLVNVDKVNNNGLLVLERVGRTFMG